MVLQGANATADSGLLYAQIVCGAPEPARLSHSQEILQILEFQRRLAAGPVTLHVMNVAPASAVIGARHLIDRPILTCRRREPESD